MSTSREPTDAIPDGAQRDDELDHVALADDARTVLYWYDFLARSATLRSTARDPRSTRASCVVELPFQAHPEIPPAGVQAGSRKGPMYTMLEREAEEAGLPLRWPPAFPTLGGPWLLPSGSGVTSRAILRRYIKVSLMRTLFLVRTSVILR